MLQVTVVGDDVVAARMLAGAADVVRRVADEGRPVADRLASAAQAFVPKRTGDLAKSITVVADDDLSSPTVYSVGPELFYGRFVESGTVKMAPRPFLYPAAIGAASDWAGAVARAAVDI